MELNTAKELSKVFDSPVWEIGLIYILRKWTSCWQSDKNVVLLMFGASLTIAVRARAAASVEGRISQSR
jgi:hypothetical protein